MSSLSPPQTDIQTANHLIPAVLRQPCQSCHPPACQSWAPLPQAGTAQPAVLGALVSLQEVMQMMVTDGISCLTYEVVLAEEKRPFQTLQLFKSQMLGWEDTVCPTGNYVLPWGVEIGKKNPKKLFSSWQFNTQNNFTSFPEYSSLESQSTVVFTEVCSSWNNLDSSWELTSPQKTN